MTFLFAAACAFVARAAQQNGLWDDRFFLPGIHGAVYATAVSGADLYAGGSFTAADGVVATNIARWNGTNWTALSGGVNAEVNAIAVRGRDVFVGGEFTTAGGASASRVARWDGTNWTALGGGIGGPRVTALAVDGAGALYAGGEFTHAGGVAVANIARWDGANWSALGTGLRNDPYAAWVLALAVRGTELFAGGFFTDAGGVSVSCIARWNGAAWSSLGAGVDDRDYLPQVTALAVSGGDLYMGGAFSMAGTASANHVARWDGAEWSALGSGLERFFGDIPVTTLAVSGARLFAGGRFVSAGGLPANNLAVWDGVSWAECGGGAAGVIHSLAIHGGDVLVGGAFSVLGEARQLSLGQWNGFAWSNLSAGGGQGTWGARSCVQTPACSGDAIAALAVASPLTYAGGAFSVAGGVPAANIACWNGSNWSALAGGLDGPVAALAWHSGKLIAAGKFAVAGDGPASNIACWNGANWSPLGGGLNGPAFALALSANAVFAGGAFSSAGGVIASNMARWDGTAWTPVGGGLNGTVYALAAQGSNLFVGGKFTSAGGVAATNIARWDGAAWSALGGGVGGVPNSFVRFRPPPVSALAVLGNDLFVGGDFAFAGGAPATNIARWNGQSWSSVGGGLPGAASLAPPPGVGALLALGGQLCVGGSFSRAGGLTANGLARWDGANWSVLGEGVGLGVYSLPSVAALAPTADGLCVGGHFKFAGSKPASDFTIWRLSPALKIARAGGAIRISWPTTATGYRLECTDSLGPGSWRSVTNVPLIIGDQSIVTLDVAGRGKFYRLQSP